MFYQLMVHCFTFSYFCNLAEEHSTYPATMTLLLRSRIRKHRVDFTSNYGRTGGASGPSEGIDIWCRWLPQIGGYVDERYLTIEAAADIKRTVAAISHAIKAPFINKDPNHCSRIRALSAVFPDSIFLYLHRDLAATAASMLNIRTSRVASGKGDLSTWVSVKPKEYPTIHGKHYVEQICEQIYYCSKNAQDDLEAVAAGRFLDVHYEVLCAKPRREVDRIAEFLTAHGIPLRPRWPSPLTFPESRPTHISQQDHQAICDHLARLQQLPVEP